MPHREIAELFAEAQSASCEEDFRRAQKKCEYLARTFASLTGEFRSTLYSDDPVVKAPHKEWKPIGDTFPEDEDFHPLQEAEELRDYSLQEWIEAPLHGYDDRASLILTLINHSKLGLETVRKMIAGGFDLRKFHRQTCHVGGGLHLLVEMARDYIFINQLILKMRSGERIGQEYLTPTTLVLPDWMSESEKVLRMAGAKSLSESMDSYDNRTYRQTAHRETLINAINADGATAEDLTAFVKHFLFPMLYKGCYLCLYNERHHVSKKIVLTDPVTPELTIFPLVPCVTHALTVELVNVLPKIEGLKRKSLLENLAFF